MPRYFFHIDARKPHADDVGEELESDGRAWAEALRTMRDLDGGFSPGDSWQLEVRRDSDELYVINVTSRRSR